MDTPIPTLKRTSDLRAVQKYIRKIIELKFETASAYAKKEGISVQYLSNVLSDKNTKGLPQRILDRFRLQQVTKTYWELTPVEEAPAKTKAVKK
jgi:hypothetical protein